MREGPFLDDWLLHMLADTLDDIERVRCANENRLRSMLTVHGLTDDHPDVKLMTDMVERLQRFEHESILNLQKRVRKHPLWAVFKDERGVGEKRFARLLSVIGDPAWHEQHDRHRTCRELRAYCGLHVIETNSANRPGGSKEATGAASHPHDNNYTGSTMVSVVGVAPKRQRGVKSNWNEDARKRLWLIVDSIIMANMGKNADKPGRSKYAEVYEKARQVQYGDALHKTVCVRCGPKGKPAQIGSPLSDGHKKAAAVRKVMVEILNDLWREAYRLHNE
jgi:hypothetical protein